MYTINIINHSYNSIYNIIVKYRGYYKNKIDLLKIKYLESLKNNDYKTLDGILEEKRNIEIKVVREIIEEIKPKKDFYVFLHGSYAKKLNRWHSDIDINILYNDYDVEDDIKIEELLSVILYKVFGFKGRDKIHSMMLYTKERYQICPVIVDNKYRLNFCDNKKINYLCRNNYEHIYSKIINTSRNICDFEDHLIENIEKDYYEWLYSYYVLDDKEEIYNIINNLDEIVLSKKDFRKTILLKIFQMKNEEVNIEYNNSKVLISKLNKVLKIKNMNNIYTLLTITRLFLVYNGEKIKNLDFNEIMSSKVLTNILGSEDLKKLEISINKYMLFLSKIEYLMELNKINFSSREEKNILISNLVEKYQLLYFSSIKDDYIEVYNNLDRMINMVLLKIEGEILNG